MNMLFSVNNSPFFGKDGKFVTSRHLRDRLMKETEKNLALKVADSEEGDSFVVYGRGILHLGILATCLFLGNHLDILQANFGVSWPALAKPVLDVLTLLGIAAGSYLLLFRIYVVSSRKLSNPMDYLLLVMILGLLVSGYLAGQPWNPIPYDGLMLFHALSGIVLLILIPFTKIAHCILYPLIRMGSEVAWHFPARGGSEAIEVLHGSEGREI